MIIAVDHGNSSMRGGVWGISECDPHEEKADIEETQKYSDGLVVQAAVSLLGGNRGCFSEPVRVSRFIRPAGRFQIP